MQNYNYYPYQAYKSYNHTTPQTFLRQNILSYQPITPSRPQLPPSPTPSINKTNKMTVSSATHQQSNYPQYSAAVSTKYIDQTTPTTTTTMSATSRLANQYPNQYNFNTNYHMPFVSHQQYNQLNYQQRPQQLSNIQPYNENHARYQLQTQQQNQQVAVPTSITTITTPTSSQEPTNGSDKITMDALEIANFLANELNLPQLVTIDGIQSGIPTNTTSTLTPTTLRSIEESLCDLTSDHPYQAGFIPPPLASFSLPSNAIVNTTYDDSVQDDMNDSDAEDSQDSFPLNENSMASTDMSSGATDSTSYPIGFNGIGNTSNNSSNNDFSTVNAVTVAKPSSLIQNTNNNTSNCATKTTTRRNQGGRRPNKSTNITPEEEEKRRIRRERNKLAAARCRKRRVDQTNELLEEVAGLEKKRECLEKEIESLNATKEQLKYILEAHRPTCQKIRQDLLTVNTINGLIVPTTNTNGTGALTGMDTTLASIASRSDSPLDLKPVLNPNMFDVHIKNEPLDTGLDSSGSSLEYDELDRSATPKRKRNTMIPPPLPNVASLTASIAAAAASASLNTPIVTTAPVSFGSIFSNNATLNTLNALNNNKSPNVIKQRPNTLPTIRRTMAQADINCGIDNETPSKVFNFVSLMDGGTGLTPVSGPLMPTCSALENKHPMELNTPTGRDTFLSL